MSRRPHFCASFDYPLKSGCLNLLKKLLANLPGTELFEIRSACVQNEWTSAPKNSSTRMKFITVSYAKVRKLREAVSQYGPASVKEIIPYY